jgi:predicted ATP-grasp superfamily ATP-dependent carboligase
MSERIGVIGRGAGGLYRSVIITDNRRKAYYRQHHSKRYRALVSSDRRSGDNGGPGTVLLTLGRLPVALDLARGFDAAGWRVVVAEPFGMHLCRMSRSVHSSVKTTAPVDDPQRYRDDLLAVVDRFDVDLVVPVSEETAFVAGLGSDLPDSTRLFSPAEEQVLRLHDKFEFIQWAKALGLPAPATWRSEDDSHVEMTSRQDFVVKPRNACSGIDVRFFEAGASVPEVADCVVQERLDGRLLSSFTIASDGNVMVTSVYEATVLDGSVGVCFERVANVRAVENWINRFVSETKHSGFISFDFIVDAEGVASAIECNPRATSGIHWVASRLLPAAICDTVALPRERAYRDATALTESYSCFTAVLSANGEARTAAWRALLAAEDVTWRRDDPWPFLLMIVNTWKLLWLSASRRVSFAQAAVTDIQGREPERSSA